MHHRCGESRREGRKLRLVYWNSNGFKNKAKHEDVVDCIEGGVADVVFIDETHVREGENIDWSCFRKHKMYSALRGPGEKGGGGKLVIVREDVLHMTWRPAIRQGEHLENERLWLLLLEGQEKVAVCSVYMAAEVAGLDSFKTWNEHLYAALQEEMECLRAEGYKCVIIGDLNGHVGDGPGGIGGNRPEVNFNGQLILDFCASNRLKMINADTQKCSGLFTRVANGSCSILDYVLVDEEHEGVIGSMKVDEEYELMCGSDHVAVSVELEVRGRERVVSADSGLFVPEKADFTAFQEEVNRLLDEECPEQLSVNERAEVLAGILRSAGEKYFKKTARIVGRTRPGVVKAWRARRRVAAANYSKLARTKGRRLVEKRKWTDEEQKELDERKEVLEGFNEELKVKIQDFKLRKRRRLRSRQMSAKEFWRTAKRYVKRAADVSIIKDSDGIIHTEDKNPI